MDTRIRDSQFWKAWNEQDSSKVAPTTITQFRVIINEACSHEQEFLDSLAMFREWADSVRPVVGDVYDGPRCAHCNIPTYGEYDLCQNCDDWLYQIAPGIQYTWLYDYPIIVERGKRKKRRIRSQANRARPAIRRRVLPCQRVKLLPWIVKDRQGRMPKHVPESLHGPKGIKRR